MSEWRFRVIALCLAAAVLIGGAMSLRAQCNGGCNEGYEFGCYQYNVSGCSQGDVCEGDLCGGLCSNIQSYHFCVSSSYLCYFPSCTPIVNCC